MNLVLEKKTVLFSFIFFIIMAGYALLRELRDSVFIHLVGLSFLPKVKLFSLCFLFFELLCYQKLIDTLKPKNTFLFFTGIYSVMLMIFGCLFCYSSLAIPSFFGYLFYILLEGYPPFIWSLLWAIFTTENSASTVKNNYMIVSLFAQIGGFAFSFLFYYLIKKNIFSAINFLFGGIMITSAFLLIVSALLMYYLKQEVKPLIVPESPKKSQGKQYATLFLIWYYSFKKIIQSLYVTGIFLIIFCWEVINITLNYFRLDVLLEQTASKSVYLLQDLYYSISLTYFLGIFVVLIGASFLVSLYGVKKTLIAFPALLSLFVLPLLIFGKKEFLVMIYMIIKALYPALIFPIKESLYLVTSEEIRYKSKSWIDGLGSRLSKTVAAFYIQISLLLQVDNRYILHIVFFSILFILFLSITSYVGRIWEEKINSNQVIE
jgi:ATP/ADP translocase